MSVHLQMKLTAAGNTALFTAVGTGVDLELTHIQLGSGNRVPDGTEATLVTPEEFSAIAGGGLIGTNQIRMTALFSSAETYNVSEVGVWSGEPGVSGSILFAYYSTASGYFATKDSAANFMFTHDMTISDASAITIVVDGTGAAALLVLHESAANPHDQYVTDDEMTAAFSVHAADSDPHPGYMTHSEDAAIMAAHVAASDPHPGYTTAAELAAAVDAAVGLGSSGQTWQNVAGSRTSNTVYQNTTGKPIMVLAWDSVDVGVVKIGATPTPDIVVGQNPMVIPNGWYYMLYMTTSVSILTWWELRG